MIHKYKNEKRSSKDFRYYQYPIELFKVLRNDNINPKEVLKKLTLNQTHMKQKKEIWI